ncbi:hypothetical protein AB836_00700 [Rickettsiales bacterium (ex Bugula neritina AB1)]|nr:hypothetical protein AB836_00700 [Rickettsiales bacterium (ex Bugula neritina AB1)]
MILFFWSSYEDFKIGFLSVYNVIALSIYTFFYNIFLFNIIFILYFIHKKYFYENLGFGDIWYIILIYNHIPNYFTYYITTVIIFGGITMIALQKKSIKFLPILYFVFLPFFFIQHLL